MTDVKAATETRLRAWFADATKDLETKQAKQLLQYVETVVLRAGKRARPKLLHLTYEGYAGKSHPALLDIGLALELHHQFLLIHDDVMDDDLVRYDGPNVAGLYIEQGTSKPIASSLAILAGNLLFSYADELILDNPHLQADQKVALLKLLHATNRKVQQGQQLDIANVTDDPSQITEAQMLQINSLKTAAYTVHLPMQMAAELLDLPKPERQKIDDFAEAFGILYQMVDDYSDYFPNNSTMNTHPKFRDFRQGKMTFPLCYALRQSIDKDKEWLLRYFGQKQIANRAQLQITDLLKHYTVDEMLVSQIARRFNAVNLILDRLGLSAYAAKAFSTFLETYKV